MMQGGAALAAAVGNDTGAENVQERSTSTAEMLGPRDDPVVNRIVCVNRYRRLP